jgi:GNAT superfamily N-acetyltransferase
MRKFGNGARRQNYLSWSVCNRKVKMKIKEISKIEDALPLVWDVFCKYEAVNYPVQGEKAFWDAIHSEEYLQTLHGYGAYEGERLIGVIATRDEGRHIALFFVDGEYHRSGIGRRLWQAVLEDNISEAITVNSSIYAKEVYEHLGFEQTDTVRESDGIKYVPMKYIVSHARHADSKRCRPCVE